MSSPFSPKIVTGNDLLCGDVVYLSSDDTWVRQHENAELLWDSAHATTRLAYADQQQAQIVGAYLADATAQPSGPAPVHFREKFRARGPSNLPHGKQSEQNNVSI